MNSNSPAGHDVGGFRVYLALFQLGFISAVAQIVLLRRGIVHFSGNELGLSVGLLCWLMWVGLGSLLGRNLLSVLPKADRLMHPGLFGLAILLPVSVVAFDLARPVAGVPVGQVVGLGFMILSFALLMAPFCLLNGGQFALASSLLGPGRAHLAFASEAGGAAAGGVLFFAVGWRLFDGLGVSVALTALVGSVTLLSAVRKAEKICAVILGAAALATLLWQGPSLDRLSMAPRYAGFLILDQVESPLGSLTWAVSGRDAGLGGPGTRSETLFYNGSPVLSHPDLRSAELAAHPALLVHSAPRKVLLVASHATGILSQILSHPIESVHVVLTDRAVLEMERQRVASTRAALVDPRVHVVIGDGRRFLRSMERGLFDVVIVDASEPDTLGLNRFFSEEFFRQAAGAMAENGVLAVAAGEPSNYIPAATGRFLASLDRAAASSLAHRRWYPLGRYLLLAGKEPVGRLTGPLADSVSAERGLRLGFVRSDYLDADLSDERMAAVEEAISSNSGERANTDLLPLAVLNRLLLWRGRTEEAGILAAGGAGGTWSVFVWGLAVMVAAFFALAAAGPGGAPGAVLIFLGGFAGIGAEAVLLYLFQVGYGYLYSRIALLLAVYMAGMGAGALLRTARSGRPPWWWAGFFLLMASAASFRVWEVLPEPAGLVFFSLAMGSAGILTGMCFAVGAGILEECGWRRAGGAAYGIDLAGATAGALVCGLVLPLVAGLEGPVRLCLLLSVGVAAGMQVRKK